MRRHLFIFVPGIGGSVLCDSADPGSRSVVWDASIANLLHVARRPEALVPDAARPLVPVGLVGDAGVLPGWNIIHGYTKVERGLRALDDPEIDVGDPALTNLDARVLFFPYDFRLGVVAAAERLHDEIERRLEHLGASSEDPRVVLVGHSMGGLVARYYMGALGGWTRVRSLITLGTPHRGAPKAARIATKGVRVGPVRLGPLSDVVASWPGLYDLLPTYEGVLDTRTGERKYLSDLPIPIALQAGRSRAMHDDITEAWAALPRSGPQMLVRLGWSHPTLSDMSFDGEQLSVTESNSYFHTTAGWADLLGDGTVPAPSAIPAEMSATAPHGLLSAERHARLAVDDSIFTLAREVEGYPSLAAVRESGEAANDIGLDLPECTAGPFEIAATVTGEHNARMWYEVRRHGEQGYEARGELLPDRGAYRAPVDLGGEPGMFEVLVTATGLPGNREAQLTDSIAVLEA